VLQSRFVIVCGLCDILGWRNVANIIKACIIMHNMIIKDEWALNLGFECEHGATNLRFECEQEVNSSIFMSYGKIIELYEFL
jgi:hypothetical protein